MLQGTEKARKLAQILLAVSKAETVKVAERDEFHRLEVERGPLGPWRRQALIHHVRVLADRYGLEAEVAGHLARADRADLTGLSTDQLVGVLASITKAGAAIDTACDWPDRPPAR